MDEVSWNSEPEDDVTLEANWLFKLRRERYRSRATGKAHDYYVMHLADAVNVIAVTPDDEVLLVRQFRVGSRKDSLETPGGVLNLDEDPLVAGARELCEETGYVGDTPCLINCVWSNPSIMSSRTTTILIKNAVQQSDTAFDEHEELVLEKVPARRLLSMINDGTIDHALAVQGLLAWMITWPTAASQNSKGSNSDER
jgi:8-oxo-dGTP pyrophosphatase MutT (NUDIX family)